MSSGIPTRALPSNGAARLWPLVLLFGLDCILIVLHVCAAWLDWVNPAWSIEQDRGFGEGFQYMKQMLCIGFLLSLSRRPGLSGVSLTWLVLILWMLLDDAFSWHEAWAAATVQGFGAHPPWWASGPNFELLFMLVTGGLALSAIALVTWRAPRGGRELSLGITALFCVFALFAVGVDYVHALSTGPVLHAMLGVVEEGGEMFSLSLLVWWLYLLRTEASFPRPMALRKLPVRQWAVAGRAQRETQS